MREMEGSNNRLDHCTALSTTDSVVIVAWHGGYTGNIPFQRNQGVYRRSAVDIYKYYKIN